MKTVTYLRTGQERQDKMVYGIVCAKCGNMLEWRSSNFPNTYNIEVFPCEKCTENVGVFYTTNGFGEVKILDIAVGEKKIRDSYRTLTKRKLNHEKFKEIVSLIYDHATKKHKISDKEFMYNYGSYLT